MSDFNLYSVNWQDGMLITQQHLKDQETYFETLARWYAASSGDAWGLMRKTHSGKPALTLNMARRSNRLIVEVVRCQAITPDGTFVEINESTRPQVRGEIEVSDSQVALYLAASSGTKQTTGDPDPTETIPRLPYLTRAYTLYFGQPPNLPEGTYLKIAELEVGEGEVTESDNFYPPCLNVFSDERLYQKACDFRNRLETLLALVSRAHMAVVSDHSLQSEKTELQLAFRETLHQLVYHLAASLDSFQTGRNAQHPLDMVLAFKKLFRVISASLNLHPGLKDYLNEKLFSKSMSLDLPRFMATLDSFLLADYDHQNIAVHVASIDDILGVLRTTFEFLGKVDSTQLGAQATATDMITYAGKTYRLVTYSGSRMERVGELSFLVVDGIESCTISDCTILLAKDIYTAAEWSTIQIRLGLNDARALGETDPIDIDTVTYGNKVALHPRDMLELSGVTRLTLMFRGSVDPEKLSALGPLDLQVYAE